jgi:hypothetical protein
MVEVHKQERRERGTAGKMQRFLYFLAGALETPRKHSYRDARLTAECKRSARHVANLQGKRRELKANGRRV